jgi:hypothetical protein
VCVSVPVYMFCHRHEIYIIRKVTFFYNCSHAKLTVIIQIIIYLLNYADAQIIQISFCCTVCVRARLCVLT